ncbi:hypothetical protein EMCRGX_G033519 [Ephydatia muelleri]
MKRVPYLLSGCHPQFFCRCGTSYLSSQKNSIETNWNSQAGFYSQYFSRGQMATEPSSLQQLMTHCG